MSRQVPLLLFPERLLLFLDVRDDLLLVLGLQVMDVRLHLSKHNFLGVALR